MDESRENTMSLNPPLNNEPPKLIFRQYLEKHLTWEVVIFALLVMLAIFSRFYDLGVRVMSHDETQHTYFSWQFYRGNGYTHTPLTHGPLQFHLMALSYTLFGDNDLAGRIPHALASVLGIIFLWKFRPYLGKTGTLVTTFLMIISPFMLYYGRYARNESLVVLFGLIALWAILRYLEKGETRYLVYLAAATAFHFTAKETAFIYTAQALFFLTLLLVQRVTSLNWRKPAYYRPFLLAILSGMIMLGVVLLASVINARQGEAEASLLPSFFTLFPEILGILSIGLAIFCAIRGLGLPVIRQERAYHLAMLLGLIVLPQLTPIPVKYLGWNPLDYSTEGMLRTAAVLIPIVIINIGLGIWWNWRVFLTTMAVFYGIYTLFYTTLFSYGAGFFTGLIGSLGYWLDQQAVERGSQPWYYYLLVQVPLYEYLPLLGAILTAGIVSFRRLFSLPVREPAEIPAVEGNMPLVKVNPETLESIPDGQDTGDRVEQQMQQAEHHAFNPHTRSQKAPALALFGFWAVTSLAAYTIAGEKMPWLTVHITLPLILLAGWGLGQLIESVQWKRLFRQNGLWVLLLVFLFTGSLRATFDLVLRLATGIPLAPPEMPGIVAYIIFTLVSGGVLFYLLRHWHPGEFARLALLTGFAILALLTARAAWQAAFIRYDEATEFMVYAHSAPSNKILVEDLTELSERINGDLSLGIAFDNSDGQGDPGSAWPLTWYLRNFTNTRVYGPDAPRELLDYPIIFASDRNWDRVEPLLRDSYYQYQYIRMWWPRQDYFDLTWERLTGAITDPAMRSALWDIWLNRDYTAFGQLTGQEMRLANWQPSRSMRMYVRKDISAMLWNRGSSPISVSLPEDPYAGGKISLAAETVLGGMGSDPGSFQGPRGLAIAPDGSLYIADTNNHRIQHLSPTGEVLHIWGSYSGSEASLSGTAVAGSFNEPWDVAVGPDGFVYVADTWNNRIQKFTAEGVFITSWGYFGQGETADAFWGPRAISVDDRGRVFVSDTGNKRVVMFTNAGEPLSVINLNLNEPVGVDVAPDGRVYIADTWNQRVVVAVETAENIFTQENTWPIDGWYGQSLDNKPYIAVSDGGYVYLTDPEGFRVLQFTLEGEFIQTWGEFGSEANQFSLPAGIAATGEKGVWVSDPGSHQIKYFQVP
jgi:predicted membrane-bound mannosyltransferase/DNA-binding beta-propeller fold protein YncE